MSEERQWERNINIITEERCKRQKKLEERGKLENESLRHG